MTFNPRDHLIQLKGKDYLQTNARVAWFRDEHPDGSIATEVISTDPVLVKATVLNGSGHILATGHAGAKITPNAVWNGREIEKAETGAVGRALANAGYGTLFALEDGDDQDEAKGGHLSDSPVQRNGSRTQAQRDRLSNTGGDGRVIGRDEPERSQVGGDGWQTYVFQKLTIQKRDKGEGYTYIIHCGGTNVVSWESKPFRDAGVADDNMVRRWKDMGKHEFPRPLQVEARQVRNSEGHLTWEIRRIIAPGVPERITAIEQI